MNQVNLQSKARDDMLIIINHSIKINKDEQFMKNTHNSRKGFVLLCTVSGCCPMGFRPGGVLSEPWFFFSFGIVVLTIWPLICNCRVVPIASNFFPLCCLSAMGESWLTPLADYITASSLGICFTFGRGGRHVTGHVKHTLSKNRTCTLCFHREFEICLGVFVLLLKSL